MCRNVVTHSSCNRWSSLAARAPTRRLPPSAACCRWALFVGWAAWVWGEELEGEDLEGASTLLELAAPCLPVPQPRSVGNSCKLRRTWWW